MYHSVFANVRLLDSMATSWQRFSNILATFAVFSPIYLQAPQVSVQETTSKRWMFGHTGLSFTRLNVA